MKPRGPSEAQIQSACDDLLMLDGWRVIKTDLPHLRGLGVQEKGMPDRLYLRYGAQNNLAEALWIEWKKRGGKSAQHQKDWHARERARGALVVVAGEAFPASVDGFMGWYRESGLQRVSIRLMAYRMNSATPEQIQTALHRRKSTEAQLGEILAESLAKAKE